MNPPRPSGDPAGGPWRPVWAYLVLALVALGVAAWLLLGAGPGADEHTPVRLAPAASGPMAGPAEAGRVAAVAMAPRPASPVAGQPSPAAATEVDDDLAAHIPPGQVPTMKQVIEGLHQRGIRTGIGAFNPPGTRPALIGLAVPEGFELPPGYVRHHQATDDGQRIEPILMFDPDHPPPAAAGRSLVTPAERVVPAELAPAGLPIRMITLPSPADPGSPPR